VKPTDEQQKIIEHQGDARISAVAGSGKTATLVKYAQARPHQRILYLAYNRSVKEEALRKFAHAGCRNVTVETAHSLAYRALDVRRRFQLSSSGNLRVNEIADVCGLKASAQHPNYRLLLARHIQKALNLFCNSGARSFADIDYLEILTEKKVRDFASRNLDTIIGYARWLMSEMYEKRLPITHDAYLKFYQLGTPSLSRYAGILYDEGQDSSEVMLDVFLRQTGKKLIMGDRFQAIYGFRHAVNSLDKAPFESFNLTTSFRFRQEIADLAMQSLALKRLIGRYPDPVRIIGTGNCTERISYAVLARTNLRLLKEAIDAILYKGKRRLFFEGNLESYTYMSDGASLFDVLYLRLGQTGKIRSPFIRSFGDFFELLEYIQAAGDGDLHLVVEIVQEYGPSLIDFIQRLRQLQVPRDQAEVIFSTVHKAKGQEYDTVEIMDDFLNGERIKDMLSMARKDPEYAAKLDLNKISEEINILYVALTRARNTLMMGFDVSEGAQGESDYYVYNGSHQGGVPPIPAVPAW
jgi:superfamily I DNA/RNA helicase